MASEDSSSCLEQEDHALLILSRTDRKPRASIRPVVAISIEEREHVICSSCCLPRHHRTTLGYQASSGHGCREQTSERGISGEEG